MAKIYKSVLRPLLFRLDAERVHDLAVKALKVCQDSAILSKLTEMLFKVPDKPVELMGLKFKNPVGLAAGFDKNGEIPVILSKLGFGFVEIGTVTFNPQPGNPKPRLFRISRETALVNNMGFNNAGAAKVAENLTGFGKTEIPLGVNIGKNSLCEPENASKNCIDSLKTLHPFADYLVLNISCPNVKDLKKFHRKDLFGNFLGPIAGFLRKGGIKKPVFVKISPDITDEELENAVDLLNSLGFGVIATNTADGKKLNAEKFAGGAVSGKPLEELSNEVVKKIRKISGGIPLIAGGGVCSPESARKKLDLGANLVQVYTGFVYEGPFLAKDLIRYM